MAIRVAPMPARSSGCRGGKALSAPVPIRLPTVVAARWLRGGCASPAAATVVSAACRTSSLGIGGATQDWHRALRGVHIVLPWTNGTPRVRRGRRRAAGGVGR